MENRENFSWWKTGQLLKYEQTVGSICKDVANQKLTCTAVMSIHWYNYFGGEFVNGEKM